MKKQNMVRTLSLIALLTGVFVAAGNDVYAQDGGYLGSGGGRQMMGSGARDGQVVGPGALTDGGMLGSGTLTDGGGAIGSGTAAAPEDDGGLIGSGTRSQILGSGSRTSSFLDTMMRFFGF
jgi:hypothetical protein